MGYPTANVVIPESLSVPEGVWEARVVVGGRSYGGVAFVGGGVVEAHLFCFEGDLYGRVIEVGLGRFIRPKREFTSTDDLRRQIGLDIAAVR